MASIGVRLVFSLSNSVAEDFRIGMVTVNGTYVTLAFKVVEFFLMADYATVTLGHSSPPTRVTRSLLLSITS